MSKKLILAIVLVLSGLLASLTSYDSYAATQTGSYGIQSISTTINGTTYTGTTVNNSGFLAKSWDSSNRTNFNGNLTALCFDTYNPVPAGAYMSVVVRMGQPLIDANGSTTNSLGLHNTFAGFASSSNWAIVSQNVESLDGLFVTISVSGIVGSSNSSSFCFEPINGSYIASVDVWNYINLNIAVSPVSFYTLDGNDSLVSVMTNNGYKLDSINSGITELNSTMEEANNNQGRVADVAEDEYNQTQEDRENASSDANGFSFNFSLPNPFGLFQVSDGCVNTPVIDSWLHLEGDWESPHCPVFPANVRSALTPVLSLLISLACLMVVIRWVSSSSSDVANGINTVVKSEKGGKS